MALPATVRRFEIELADSDRGVYATLDWRVAQHPSEHARYLVARIVARALEHADGVEFTRGLAADDEPAVWQRDLRGDLVAWIEVGAPSPERLHRASKTGARVVVYAWKSPEDQARALAEAHVHRAAEISIRALDPAFLDAVAVTLDRTNRWELAIAGGTLYLGITGTTFETAVRSIAPSSAS
jgi:uncharacterized protein YaeQ